MAQNDPLTVERVTPEHVFKLFFPVFCNVPISHGVGRYSKQERRYRKMGILTISGICDKLVYRLILVYLVKNDIPLKQVSIINEGDAFDDVGIEVTFRLDAIDDAYQMFNHMREETHGEADIKLELTSY